MFTLMEPPLIGERIQTLSITLLAALVQPLMLYLGPSLGFRASALKALLALCLGPQETLSLGDLLEQFTGLRKTVILMVTVC